VQGDEGQFLATFFCCTFMFMDFYLCQFIILLGMPDGDAMDDIVDELGENEITEESGKLFFFLRYLDKQ
jgi:hypothetical protein